ncbi:MAG TPA: FAD-dependent monooxygenase, partial [Terricaulis sp.]|nr:FAD-dependent monooxygenase [Terricaulis sp.]
MSNGFDADVILGGGGLVGQTLALALDQAGLKVIVIDASKPAETLAPAFDGRAFAIAFASYRMWRALGIGDALDEVAQPIREILVTDGNLRRGPSPLYLHFEGAEQEEKDEPLGLMLEARHVRLALDTAVKARPSIQMIQPMSVSALKRDPAGVTVTLADGRNLRAPLLVGADGRRSFVRGAVGVRTIGWDYPVTAIVATIAHEKPHEGVAHEYFLPNGPFAILP